MALLSRNHWPFVFFRTAVCVVVFVLGILALRVDQIIVWTTLRRIPRWYYTCMDLTKFYFLQLIVFVTSFASPCKIKISFRATELPELNTFRVDASGNLISSLSRNAIFISNHQIYTDWIFLWFLAYTSNLANSIYIVIKESLSRVPLLGPGMLNFRFLFLLRKWENDKVNLTNRLLAIDADARGMGPAAGVSLVSSSHSASPSIVQWPKGMSGNSEDISNYQLVIFPEGTVLSPHTRERSNRYADKMDRPRFNHLLLPRARGLFLMLRLLRNTLAVVYDVSCGYSGLNPDEYGEEKFTLKKLYLQGLGPSAVNYFIRGFPIKDIPLGDDDNLDVDDVDPKTLEQFEDWLYNVWCEKDKLMKSFYETGSFVVDDDETMQTVVAKFKLKQRFEILTLFAIPGTLLLLAYWIVKKIVNIYTASA
ncbi:acyltransferase-domain-containing protein [Metschnikowia bicuspidata var. bicuspidata NRRL YB-4993]|uniref:Acyltransferase-domain-containing protein n=1 Tax=Metschnikowia bicuspidata var. bicuspidata NRRL YB-4993 TaxID=869754 RepID=A0A1A0HB81_9ASCO|nr:acyltransferase-domain-containing protein [Metschnikowia bicuspidata var. bicuspidata NRRL YB-4993]OBA21245.1 acyltransferase-domain-containing protein [Metschnikowia bicuspidata var. bicuspidata NRRL YB-4993]